MGHYVVMKEVDFCTDKDVQDHVEWNCWERMRGEAETYMYIFTYVHIYMCTEKLRKSW